MPLRRHPSNPRYFADAAGRAVYLTGSHHWDNLIDNGERPGGFDFERYLDRLEAWGHNFIRLWAHEAWTHDLHPRPYLRTGPGTALDGGPRFDLTRFDPEYFARLRERVARAGERGFQVSVMLFNGWSIHDNGEGNPWDRHPFHRGNNVNAIDGDPGGRGHGADLHTLRIPAVTRLQEAYAAKLVETVGDLDHVLWEISNESPGGSRDWQRFLAGHLRRLDAGRHPIGLFEPSPGPAFGPRWPEFIRAKRTFYPDALLTPGRSYSCSTWWTKETAIEPSPTAEATRLTLPARTSPTANTPGRLVSRR